MQFGPDVDVICPQCGEKAYFTFPYRMLNAPYVLEAKAAYPEAEYQEIAPYTRLEGPRIIKHFVNGSFYFNPQESTWLINLFPKLFSFENAGAFNGLVKCLRCGLVKNRCAHTRKILVQNSGKKQISHRCKHKRA